MAHDIIDYGKLVDEAMHVIVYRVLKIIQERGLPGNHHFFISFVTKHPGVKLSKTLTNKYIIATLMRCYVIVLKKFLFDVIVIMINQRH